MAAQRTTRKSSEPAAAETTPAPQAPARKAPATKKAAASARPVAAAASTARRATEKRATPKAATGKVANSSRPKAPSRRVARPAAAPVSTAILDHEEVPDSGLNGRFRASVETRGAAENRNGRARSYRDNFYEDEPMFSASQLAPLLRAMEAARNGDFSVRLALPRIGSQREDTLRDLHVVFNDMMRLNDGTARELSRIGRIAGREGRLNERARLPQAGGAWNESIEAVNELVQDLARPTREIARVITAVAQGDLSQKMVLDVDGTPLKGEFLRIRNTVNTMVDQLSAFSAEVTRVAREVGTEGKLGGQANVRGVSGTWKDLTDNVNFMASNLTDQVRGIARVVTAVANGDLGQKLTVEARGEVAALAETINSMTGTLSIFADQVTTVAREVGTEGKLGGQAHVPNAAGTWKDLTDNVNSMAGNLTGQVRNIALVTTAVAMGDLSQKITVDARGEILELKNTINVMVDQLNAFAAEVTRVAREVGTEGNLGGQAVVSGVSGTWKDLTDNVNFMASNLTNQVRNIALVTTAVANGDLSQKITVDVRGEILELKNTVNVMVDQLNAFAAEVTRVAREVGTEGKLGGQANVRGVSGTWKDLTDNVNFMASNLTDQVRGIARVVTAVAQGDLEQKLVLDARGEVAALAETINSMTDTLSTFAEQVTDVAREVGTEGKLGGQAKVPNTAGTWKDLTDNVNFMAGNLTTQVRGIARVVNAVAAGDLKQKLVLDARGEVAALAETINSMTDTLSTFAEQVTTVAREVGTEGKLGGQAAVPRASGTWKDLTDNVNFMANSLTVQVRSISDVATAVTKGDLTQTITVDAQGEVSELKDNINQMIANLKQTTEVNTEQDWLKTNLARFSRLMQGQKSLGDVGNLIMSELTPLVSAHHGAFYINDTEDGESVFKLLSTYAYRERKSVANRFRPGEGLVGQCALEKKSIILTKVPPDYIQINSGLGEAAPLTIIVLPVLFENEILGVLELASFEQFSAIHTTFLDQLTESIGIVLNTISANMRTEELLVQSQTLTQELQSQSEELQNQQDQLKRTNMELEEQAAELEEKASLLVIQNQRVEQKNYEVEQAREALEEKAAQLALSSKYKSEFLANMSHELRTPLNSMLILAKLLSDNAEHNLTEKQVEFASTIHSSGGDLLALINEILDLSKVESGKMEVDIADVAFAEICDYSERSFDAIAEQKGLTFDIRLDEELPASIRTDSGRLQQVLKNLLSNAFKFTEEGSVTLDIVRQDDMVAFSVIDTGIGIAPDKQDLIFEAFQQADGTTSRRYGGTGLGLSISREIARLLGGRLTVSSVPGEGSVFTLILPLDMAAELAYSGTSFENGPFGDEPFGDEAFGNGPYEDGPYGDGSPDGTGSARFFGRAGGSASLERGLSALLGRQNARSLSSGEENSENAALIDDRRDIQEGDRVLLIIEDDEAFARILFDMAKTHGFKTLVAMKGDEGLRLAKLYHPDAITLDLHLPLVDGWTVLDALKRDPETRHIPVQVISIVDRDAGVNRVTSIGAIAYLEKPVSAEALDGAFSHISSFIDREVRHLLIVEDDQVQMQNLIDTVSGKGIEVQAVASAEEALAVLETQVVDCMVLDLGLPGMSGLELLRKIGRIERLRNLPVIIYTSQDLTKRQEAQLKRYAVSILAKNPTSPDLLLQETTLFLHRLTDERNKPRPANTAPANGTRNTSSADNANAADNATAASNAASADSRGADAIKEPVAGKTRKASSRSSSSRTGSARTGAEATDSSGAGDDPDDDDGGDPGYENTVYPHIVLDESDPATEIDLGTCTALVVDDDVRNIFALTSVLENYGVTVLYADNGRDALALMQEPAGASIDLVLMDVMMPGMDGYTTTQAMRRTPPGATLPIIALTAKAMPGDREKCLDAGASDYITKPVDIEQLLPMMRRWIKWRRNGGG